jgi:hypothetical protein
METILARISIAAVILSSMAATPAAPKQPEYKELIALLGKHYESKEVKAFATRNNLSRIIKFEEGSFSPPDESFRVWFNDGKISRVILKLSLGPKNPETKDWKVYSQPLPAGLSPGDSREKVIKKLGEPTPGNPRTDEGKSTWVAEGLNIWIAFNEDGSRIDQLFLKKQTNAKPK